jgi:heme/copper-type cytochrome/quinol oxidase subunit 2
MPSPLAAGLFWAAVLSCAIAQAAILRSVAGRRATSATRRPWEPTATDAGASAEALMPAPSRPLHTAGEIVWAIVPAIALGVVLVFTWRAMHGDYRTPAATTGVMVSAPSR